MGELNMPIKILSSRKTLSGDVRFITQNCYLPDQFIPCTENTEGYLRITNQGDADQCGIIYQLKGVNYLLWEGPMEAGETIDFDITVHFPPEEYPETEALTITFIAGYMVEGGIVPTDQIAFDVLIYVQKTDWVTWAIIGGIAIGSVGILYTVFRRKEPAIMARPVYEPQHY